MRSGPLLRALATGLALAAAAPASALSYGGYVGLQYARDDAWATSLQHSSAPHLDLNLGLSLDGYVYTPGAFAYTLAGDYRRTSFQQTGAPETVQNFLQYRARATAFGDPRTPLSVSAHAQRSTEQSASTSSNPVGLDVDSRTYGVDMRYRQPDRPLLSASYVRTESINHVPGLADATRLSDNVGVSTSHGAAGYSYAATYYGAFNQGTYVTDAFDNHRVSVFAKAGVADKTEVRIADSYYLRVPTELSPFSPRQELNSLNATVIRRTGLSDFDEVGYSYSRGVQEAPGAEVLDRLAQQATYAHQHTLANPELRLRANVDATLSQNRLGTTETRDAGQSLGLGVTWARNLPDLGYIEVRGGPSVGVIEPSGGSAQWGYGGSAGGTYRRAASLTTYEATYDLSFASHIGDLGTALRQQAQGSATTPVGVGAMRGQLTFSALRRDSPRVGAAAYRSATLMGGYSWRRYTISADAGITSGVSVPVQNPGFGDGLFLSLPYDTHTYSASVGGNAGITDRLSLGAVARFVATAMPDRPDTTESELRGSVRYAVGALALSLEERYTISQIPGGTTRRNLFFFSVNRAFGSTRY
jgi:hypothetical protein